jgi:hypothetical protein
MANSVKEPFDWPELIFEVKLDAYRAITVFDETGLVCGQGTGYPWTENSRRLRRPFLNSNCAQQSTMARLLLSMKTAFHLFSSFKVAGLGSH